MRTQNYTLLHAFGLFYVLHFGLWRLSTFGESSKGRDDIKWDCVCCVRKKERNGLYLGLCLQKTLPTMPLLFKLNKLNNLRGLIKPVGMKEP